MPNLAHPLLQPQLNIFWSKIVYFCFFCWWFSYTHLWSVRVHPQFCPLSNLGMDLDWPVIHNPYRWSWNHINYPLTLTWKENRETWLYAKTSQFNSKKKFSNRLNLNSRQNFKFGCIKYCTLILIMKRVPHFTTTRYEFFTFTLSIYEIIQKVLK